MKNKEQMRIDRCTIILDVLMVAAVVLLAWLVWVWVDKCNDIREMERQAEIDHAISVHVGGGRI